MSKPLTKAQRELMQKHRIAPKHLTQREVMDRLKFGRDYQRFYRLFYRATIDNAK